MAHKKTKAKKRAKSTAPFSAVDKRGESFGRVVRDARVARGLLLGLPTALPAKRFRA